MSKIFYIMGKSSSGKDTLYKLILEDEELNLKKIVPYTTRPIRFGEAEGVEYFFVNEERLEQLSSTGKVVELREYQTVFGVWKYFTVDDGQVDLTKNNYLLIGTLEAYEKMLFYYGVDVMVPIYVEVDDGTRLQRALDRERQQEIPGYSEVCRRFLADDADFSKDNLENAGILKKFYNETLSVTKKEIAEYIKQQIHR